MVFIKFVCCLTIKFEVFNSIDYFYTPFKIIILTPHRNEFNRN